MPKKKITEEASLETAEKLEETVVLPETSQDTGATETTVELEDAGNVLQSDGVDANAGEVQEADDTTMGSPAVLSEETPDIVAVSLEDGASSDMPETFDMPAASDVSNGVPGEKAVTSVPASPYGIDAPAVSPEESGEDVPAETAMAVAAESAAPALVLEEEGKPASAAEKQPTENERRAFYGLDFNELDRDLTPEQRQEWNSIYASYRGHNAMSGTVVGIDRHRLRMRDRKTGEMTWHQVYCAIVIPFRVRILIPETEMWMKGQERPGFVLRNLSGAKIDFVIIHVDREAGFAVGSRKQALPSRRYYFATRPELNTVGSRTNCEVLVVGPRRCLVSCHGYDMDLTQRELSYTAVPDLREVYHSGQSLGCIVKAYDREENQLSISVKETAPNPFDGAAFRHPIQSHRQGVIAGKYGGGVFCNLPDGVTVMCNYSFHYDDSAFRVGDRVMLIIQRYDNQKKQVYGKIVAKC